MTNPEPTKEDYDTLLYKLATLENELGQARKLLEAPAKAGYWKRFWGMGAKTAVVALVVVLIGAGAWGKDSTRGFCTGNDYLGANKFYQVGYTVGVADAFFFMNAAPIDAVQLLATFDIKAAKGMTPGQMQTIAAKYMKDNPQNRHYGMAELIWFAICSAK